MIAVAVEHGKPVRIGVNWGSLDRALLTALMDENAHRAQPLADREVVLEAIRESALRSAALAESFGQPHDAIVLSAKVSDVRDLVQVYRALGAGCDYPLHLGLTEAGLGVKGIVATTAALSVLLFEGIGDTIRTSLTPMPGGDRAEEVRICQQVLQSLGLRAFAPQVSPEVEFAAPDTFFEGVDSSERRAWVEDALSKLPDHQRIPLVLYHFEEIPYDEIARRLGVSLAKVKTDLAAIQANSPLTVTQKQRLATDLLACAQGASKPSWGVVIKQNKHSLETGLIFETARREVKNRFDFLPRDRILLDDFLNARTHFQIFKNRGNGHPGIFEHPCATDLAGNAFHCRALRPIETCHAGSLPLSE